MRPLSWSPATVAASLVSSDGEREILRSSATANCFNAPDHCAAELRDVRVFCANLRHGLRDGVASA